MRPNSPNEFDTGISDLLERYFVEGEQSLNDPLIAQAVVSNPTIVTRLRTVLSAMQVRTHPSTEQSLAGALEARGLLPTTVPVGSRKTAHPHRHMPSITTKYLWPTIAVLILAFSGLYTHNRSLSKSGTYSSTQATVYTSANAQRTMVTLPDGSTALLNVASRLEVPPDFGEGHRIVKLQGEALFEVTHAEHTPFMVMTKTTSTRVLGTSFAVRDYPTDTLASVAVRDGKVAVQSVVVAAEWEAVVGSRGAITLQPVSRSRFEFESGILTLNDVPLPDAIVELSRWYDVDIRLASPILATYRVAATCPVSSIENLIAILEFTLDVRVERIGRTLTLYPKGA